MCGMSFFLNPGTWRGLHPGSFKISRENVNVFVFKLYKRAPFLFDPSFTTDKKNFQIELFEKNKN